MLLLLPALLVTCTIEEEQTIDPVKPPETVNKKNPYSVENVTQAFENLVARSGGRIKIAVPSTTHNYVQFQPQNLDQVMLLQDLGYDLWDEPLDQYIEYTGDYYQHPGLPDSLNYFYTLIPENYSITQHVPYTILSQVILFDDNAGDEQDIEDDPWIPDPDPGNGICYDEWGQPYVCGTDPRVYYRQKSDKLPEDLVKKTTKYLLDGGVDLMELYNQMMILAGYEDDLKANDPSGRSQGVFCSRYHPAGQILVRDNSVNINVPVKATFIKARRFMKLSSTYTDPNGFFYIPKGFCTKAQVIVKFKNGWAKVRGVNGGLKIWQWTKPVKVKLGLYERTAMENITHTFQYNANTNTHQAMAFMAAHAINTVFDINQYCTNNNINTIPDNINLWVTTSNWFSSSTAPMLHKVLEPAQTLSWVTTFLNPANPLTLLRALRSVMLRYAPDVVITISNNSQNGPTRNAENISRTAFHELGHAVHYNKVGRSYWLDVIARFIINKNVNNGYGNRNSTGSGLVAVLESWGYFTGPTFNRTKYAAFPQTQAVVDIRNADLRRLEHQRRDDTIPYEFDGNESRGWIPFGFLHDCIDVGEPATTGINDLVSGYTINGLFRGYTSSITTVQALRANILSQNGNSQATQVNNLVTSYGW